MTDFRIEKRYELQPTFRQSLETGLCDLRATQTHFLSSAQYGSTIFGSTADKPAVGTLSIRTSLPTPDGREKFECK